MQDALKKKLADYGAWTYRGAWALEISAAVLGLATGLTLGIQAFSSSGSESVTSIDLILASAPFFMVAVAELTKIPIATLLFSVGWRWKPIVFVFLIALAGITFETVFMGLERAATLRQIRYEDIANTERARQLERDQIDRRLAESRSPDDMQRARDNLTLIIEQAAQDRARLEADIRDVEGAIEGQRTVLPGSARFRDALKDKRSEREKIVAKRDAAIEDALGQFERQRDSFTERIKSARDARELDTARRLEDELSRLANPRRRIEAQYQGQISQLDSEISANQTEIDRIQRTAPPMASAEKQQLDNRRDELKSKLAAIDSEWEEKRTNARKAINDAQSAEADRRIQMIADQRRKDELSSELTSLENRRVEFARTDQIRRIAARFYGSRPDTVTEDQAGLVSVLWFGSLALLAAMAGPITAVVALSLQKIGTSPPAVDARSVSQLIRRMLIRWRWRRVRTIEKKIEVPVDREVEKRVEVPVETVVKEILYVPVFTDDPEALRNALTDTMPREISELLRKTYPDRRHANQA